MPNPANPQSWNRFSYVKNNPINFIDPTGHREEEGCGIGDLCDHSSNEGGGDNGGNYCLVCHTGSGTGGDGNNGGANGGGDTDIGGAYLSCGDDPECLDWVLRDLGIEQWEYDVHRHLYYNGGPRAQHGVNFMLTNGIRININNGWPSWFGRGAWYTEDAVWITQGEPPSEVTPQNILRNKWALSNIIHETLHIEQGDGTKSWKGEMEAWQTGLDVYKALNKGVAFTTDRELNAEAATNVWEFAFGVTRDDPGYGIPLLIFYPPYPATFP